MIGKKYRKISLLIFFFIFIVSFVLFFCSHNFIRYQNTPPVVIASENEKESPDIYTENYNKTKKDVQSLKESIRDGDEYIQKGDIIIVKRKNGTTEKYEIVHGIAGDSLIRIS